MNIPDGHGPYETLSDMRRANEAIGQTWWSADNIKMFRNTFPDSEYGVWYGRFIVVGRKFVGMDGRAEPREYAVYACVDGHMDRVSEWKQSLRSVRHDLATFAR